MITSTENRALPVPARSAADVLERLKTEWEKLAQAPTPNCRIFAETLKELNGDLIPGAGDARAALQEAIADLRAGPAPALPFQAGIAVAQVLLALEDRRTETSHAQEAEHRLRSAIDQLKGWLGGQFGGGLGKPAAPAGEDPDPAVLAQLGRGLILDLQRIKLALSTLERRGTPGTETQKAVAALVHIGAALRIARLVRAAEFSQWFLSMLKPWAEGSATASAQGLAEAMQALEALSRFAQSLEDRHPDPESLLPRRATDRAAPAQTAGTSEKPVQEPMDVANDAELLEIYVEEITEWLDTTAAQLDALGADRGNRGLLVEVRRSFHTLKGTSRVAGFRHLGDFAWRIEEELNHWNQQGKPASSKLLAMLATGRELVGDWLRQLETQGRVVVRADGFVAGLEALDGPESGSGLEESSEAAMPETLCLDGKTVVSRALFGIFVEEATGHLASLASFKESGAFADPVAHDLVRAAHTLAAISRTVGATAIAELAHALEKLLQKRHEMDCPLSKEERRGFQRASERLNASFQAARQGRPPEADQRLIQQLRRATALAKPPQEPAAAPGETALRPPLIDPALLNIDGIDTELGQIFIEEGNELAGQLSGEMQLWQEEPAASAYGENVTRLLHTLKGSARTAAMMPVGEIVHQVESEIVQKLGEGAPTAEFLADLQNTFDQWCDAFERALRPEETDPAAAAEVETFEDDTFLDADDGPAGLETQAGINTQLRVPTATLERLLDTSAEISLTRSRIAAELDAAKRAAADMEERVKHLREQLREIEIQAESQMHARFDSIEPGESSFDPLEFDRYTRLQELTRIMAESLYDLTAVQYGIRRHYSESEGILSMQARLQRNLHSDLMHIRTAAFETIADRLRRVARQTAAELGRPAELSISGGHLELDRTMLERLVSPLEHIIRNALAHGIEPPEQRRAAGKPEAGSLRLSLLQEVNTIQLSFSDDGGGIDLERVRSRAVKLGFIGAGEAIDEDRLRGFIFRPGFSTASELTEVAGRGVGMDVVLNAIHNMGGEVHVRSVAGEGTTFTLSLPLTLVVAQAVVVRCGERTYGIPSNLVAQVQRCNAATLMSMLASGESEWGGEKYPFRYLGDLFGSDALESAMKRNNIVLYLRTARDRLAIQVDSIVANQEFALKELGPQLAAASGIVGATISHDGRPLLLINPLQMTGRHSSRFDLAGPDGMTRVSAAPLVLIVDDSVTVRKVTSRLVERAGYRVIAAKDGVEAIEKMREEIPAIFLLDIEMPRMDGFELTKYIREDPRTEDKPIIVISSRTAEKHRQRAFELGVTQFLGKPYQDVELLRHIERLGQASRIKSSANYEERRKHPRKRPRQPLRVHDTLGQKVVGTVVNVSESGFMLQTAERFRTNRVYHMELELPGPLNGGQPLRLTTESLWLESSFEDGQFWVGFQFIQPDANGVKVLQSLVKTYCI